MEPIEVKVCIIGDSDVGKTSLSMRYCHGQFPDNSSPTIGASFLQKRVEIDGTELSLQIWDTAGQERFRSMAPMYYRGAKAAVLVFDVSNEDSFHHAVTWLKDLKVHADPEVVIVLAGNKCDKAQSVDAKKIENFAHAIEAKIVKCSALTGQGIDEVFTALARGIIDSNKGKTRTAVGESKGLSLTDKVNEPEPSTCC